MICVADYIDLELIYRFVDVCDIQLGSPQSANSSLKFLELPMAQDASGK